MGVGGIGCAVAEHLIRAGIRTIKLVDFDTVEESNLTRQMGTLSSVTAVAAGFVSYTAIMILTGLRTPKEGIQMDFDNWSIYKFPNQR